MPTLLVATRGRSRAKVCVDVAYILSKTGCLQLSSASIWRCRSHLWLIAFAVLCSYMLLVHEADDDDINESLACMWQKPLTLSHDSCLPYDKELCVRSLTCCTLYSALLLLEGLPQYMVSCMTCTTEGPICRTQIQRLDGPLNRRRSILSSGDPNSASVRRSRRN